MLPSGARSMTESGHGKLIPIPPAGIDFDVVYRFRKDFPQDKLRPDDFSAAKPRISVSMKPLFDEGYLPDGVYHLRTERGSWRIEKRGTTWEMSGDGKE